MLVTNGAGIYSREYILGLEEEKTNLPKLSAPDIKEIRAIHYNDEIYLNARDVALMMKKCSFRFNSISVCNFVKSFVLNLVR